MKGFTIIEVLVTVAIFLILTAALFTMFEAGRSFWFTNDAVVQLREEINKVFLVMDRNLRETRPSQVNLALGNTSPTLTFRLPQDIDGDGTILDALGNIEWSGNFVYALNANGQVSLTDPNGVVRILANNIINFQFTRPAAVVDILQVDITARRTTITNRVVQQVGQLVIRMRN